MALFGIFAALSLLRLWRLWAPVAENRLMIGLAEGDFLRQFYPYRAFVAGAWGSGQPPLWNPYQYAGTPALADPQLAVLYPWRLLQIPFALPGRRLPLWTVELEVMAHLALAGTFTYLLCKRLGLGRPAAFFAGLVFGFGGFLTGYPMEQLAVLNSAVWLPAVLLAVHWSWGDAEADPENRRRSIARIAVPAFVLAMPVFAGHPQTALFIFWSAGLMMVWRLITQARSRKTEFLRFALIFLGAAGFSAAQWIPSLDFVSRASRRLDPSEIAAGLPVRDSLQILAPVLTDYHPLYIGILPLVLVIWAGLKVPESRPWLGLAGFGWLVSLGGNSGWIFDLFTRILPGMTMFRHQERAALLFAFGMALAAGFGLDHVLRSRGQAGLWLHSALIGLACFGMACLLLIGILEPGPIYGDALDAAGLSNALFFSAFIAAVGAFLSRLFGRGRLSGQQYAGLFIALLALDLFSAGRSASLQPRVDDLWNDPLRASVQERAKDGRVSSEGRLLLGPNAASAHAFYDVTGDSPLNLGAISSLVEQAPEILWWRLLNVRFLIADRPEDSAPLRSIESREGAEMFEVLLPAPPAWVPKSVRCLEPLPAGSTNDFGWATAEFNPLETLVLDQGVDAGFATPEDCSESRDSDMEAQVTLTGLNPGRVEVDASLPSSAWVVLSTAYDPGWRVRAVAETGETLRPRPRRAYGAIMTVPLPDGRWTLRWTYIPFSLILGFLISMTTALISLYALRYHKGFSH